LFRQIIAKGTDTIPVAIKFSQNMLQLATKADKVITQFNIVISGKFGTAVMMTDWSSILLSSKSTAIVVAGPV